MNLFTIEAIATICAAIVTVCGGVAGVILYISRLIRDRRSNQIVTNNHLASAPLTKTAVQQPSPNKQPVVSNPVSQPILINQAGVLSTPARVKKSRSHLLRWIVLLLTLVLIFALIISSILFLPSLVSRFSTKPPLTMLLTAERGIPVYQDVLNNNSTHQAEWEIMGRGTNSDCSFQSDGYHVPFIHPNDPTEISICHSHLRNGAFQDFVITVDIAINGNGNGALLFRDQIQLGGNGAYAFEVSLNGLYKIWILSFKPSLNKTLQDWTPSSAINRNKNVRNTLQVVASGHFLSFFINKQYLTSITDGTFSDGSISFASFISGEAIFSNLKIYSL